MKIITWNCCLKLANKFKEIQALNPDILIVQECEELPEDYFPDAKYYWTGHTKTKGIGVVLFNNTAEIDSSFNNKLDYFLPLNLNNGMRLLATWSFTHRAAGRFGEGHLGHVSDAISYYREWLNGAEQAIISGDFNNSIIWDKGNKESNFKNTNQTLESLGFLSAYHDLTKEAFSEEKCPTLFHTKNREKTYHIDYIYLKGLEAIQVDVGAYDEWIKLSDHVPVVVELSIR